jgi:hypothetical protein
MFILAMLIGIILTFITGLWFFNSVGELHHNQFSGAIGISGSIILFVSAGGLVNMFRYENFDNIVLFLILLFVAGIFGLIYYILCSKK